MRRRLWNDLAQHDQRAFFGSPRDVMEGCVGEIVVATGSWCALLYAVGVSRWRARRGIELRDRRDECAFVLAGRSQRLGLGERYWPRPKSMAMTRVLPAPLLVHGLTVVIRNMADCCARPPYTCRSYRCHGEQPEVAIARSSPVLRSASLRLRCGGSRFFRELSGSRSRYRQYRHPSMARRLYEGVALVAAGAASQRPFKM